jgi:macrolide transport system ATP-binding/permease protein
MTEHIGVDAAGIAAPVSERRPPDSREAIIEVAGLTKVYGEGESAVRALAGVSLSVYPGEFVAIMGPSGSGKSTFMHLLGCLDRPTSGSYRLAGEEVAGLSRDELATVRSKRIGFVFQSFNLLARTSAVENVELPMLYAGTPREARSKRSLSILEEVGLGSRLNHRPNELSGGQQQRVAIARALVNGAPILMADEPTGNLDSASSIEIMNLFRKLNRESGITVVVVTHSTEIAAWSDRIVTFKDGLIVDDRPSEEFTARNPRVDIEARLRRAKQDAAGSPRMSFSVLLRTAWKALRRNVSRSLLTMLGIIIGVAAVISSMAIGSGAQAAVLKQIETLGANLVVITPGSITSGGVRLGSGTRTSLKLSDVSAIADNVPEVAGVAPYSQTGSQVIAGGQNWSTEITGTNTAWPSVGNWTIAQGRFFSDDEYAKVAKIAVLGSTVAANLFPAGSAVGSTVNIKNVPFTVVGVFASKGQSGFGRDQDDVVFVPITTYQQRLSGQTWVNSIQVSASSPDTVNGVIDASERLMRLQHHLSPSQGDDFTIRNIANVQQVRMATTQTQSLLLAAVAIVSLIVGGIGIMNIMLVSVSERTREIGLRMAVGARGRDIQLQFLIEALTMACAGGIIGVAMGIGVSDLVSLAGNWPTVVTAFSVILGFVSAAATGVVFGYYPARRAAALDPIEALRYE